MLLSSADCLSRFNIVVFLRGTDKHGFLSSYTHAPVAPGRSWVRLVICGIGKEELQKSGVTETPDYGHDRLDPKVVSVVRGFIGR